MKDMVVATQAEYDNATAGIAGYQNKPWFDIAANRGVEIVGEVNYLIYNYLYNNEYPNKTIEDLSRFYFSPEEACKIVDYFLEHPPGDMFDIERGLNILVIKPRDTGKTETEKIKKIIVRNSVERITVTTDVEALGFSQVEAFGNAHVIARNDAFIIAHDNVSVDAYNKSRVNSFDKACITARNNTWVHAYHHTYVKSFDNAHTILHNNSTMDAHGKSTAQAYNQSNANAWDTASIFANDTTEIHGMDSSQITAFNHSCVVGRDNARIIAFDDSLILSRDNAKAEIHDNTCHISGYDNNADNLQKNLTLMMKHPRFAHNPVLAARFLMQGVTQKNKAAINRKYLAMGCNSEDETKQILTRWIKKRQGDISRER